MNDNQKVLKFFNLLFPNRPCGVNYGSTLRDVVCMSIYSLEGHAFDGNLQFFCVNEIQKRRNDANVSCFRNFLVEFDDMPLDDQRAWVKEINMPFSTCVFSGNKSYHYILSLKEPLRNAEDYRKYSAAIHRAVEKADPSTKNPSRSSRFPGFVRPETGKVQEVVELKDRISAEDLDLWLATRNVSVLDDDTPAFIGSSVGVILLDELGGINLAASMSIRTAAFLTEGAEPGSRNKELYVAARNLADLGHSFDEAVRFLGEVDLGPDFTWGERIATIRSAFKSVGAA